MAPPLVRGAAMEKPYATVEDLEKRWRPLSATEKRMANELLMDASIELDLYIDFDVATETQIALLKPYCCRMVRRALDYNGDAYGLGQSEGGPGWTPTTEAGDPWLRQDEKERLGHQGFVIGSIEAKIRNKR